MFLYYFGLAITVLWALLALYLWYGRSRMYYLKNISPAPFDTPPVVIIIAVRNEEEHLEQALQSVLQLQYKPLRIMAINDRSTDRTGTILQQLHQQYPHLIVKNITSLPEGWLGKNHALYTGYQSTWEEWLLFVDADVVFAPDTLQKALYYATKNGLDHLTVLPEVASRSKLLNSLLANFLILLEVRQRPWDVRNPASNAYLGVGAFNLVRRMAYEKAGTHAAIALRPDDDLKLGERLKKAGCRQDAVYGIGQINLEWYTSVQQFINGLMKNSFSAFNYSFLKLVVTGVLPMLILLVLPLPLLLIFGGNAERGLALALALVQLFLFFIPGGMRAYWWYGLMVPVAGILMIYILLKAGITNIRQGGIYWRESFYPLQQLKKAK